MSDGERCGSSCDNRPCLFREDRGGCSAFEYHEVSGHSVLYLKISQNGLDRQGECITICEIVIRPTGKGGEFGVQIVTGTENGGSPGLCISATYI